MIINKILWLEDQYEDFRAYRSLLYRAGYLIDTVESVSEAEKKLEKWEEYTAVIFDIKVLPGSESKWLDLDLKKRNLLPDFDSYLGFELLRSMFETPTNKRYIPRNLVIGEPIDLSFSVPDNSEKISNKTIIFSVVNNENVRKALISFEIPEKQIVYKSDCSVATLPELIERIISRSQKDEKDKK